MVHSEYIFDDKRHVREKVRLKALETVHDVATHKRLKATGLKAGWRCLEVGPGTGSVMRWLAKRVGVRGQVIALDVNPRFVLHTRVHNVEIRQGDICRTGLPQKAYDLIHCRHVLIHTSNPKAAIRNMMAALKPGGWIVLEEPDFLASRAISGTVGGCRAVCRINAAIHTMFHEIGRDPSFGCRLPALVEPYGLTHMAVENEAPISQGKSSLAKLMNLSAQQLQEQYLATGEVTIHDIRRYRQFTDHPKSWAIYYGTVSVVGKKP